MWRDALSGLLADFEVRQQEIVWTGRYESRAFTVSIAAHPTDFVVQRLVVHGNPPFSSLPCHLVPEHSASVEIGDTAIDSIVSIFGDVAAISKLPSESLRNLALLTSRYSLVVAPEGFILPRLACAAVVSSEQARTALAELSAFADQLESGRVAVAMLVADLAKRYPGLLDKSKSEDPAAHIRAVISLSPDAHVAVETLGVAGLVEMFGDEVGPVVASHLDGARGHTAAAIAWLAALVATAPNTGEFDLPQMHRQDPEFWEAVFQDALGIASSSIDSQITEALLQFHDLFKVIHPRRLSATLAVVTSQKLTSVTPWVTKYLPSAPLRVCIALAECGDERALPSLTSLAARRFGNKQVKEAAKGAIEAIAARSLAKAASGALSINSSGGELSLRRADPTPGS